MLCRKTRIFQLPDGRVRYLTAFYECKRRALRGIGFFEKLFGSLVWVADRTWCSRCMVVNAWVIMACRRSVRGWWMETARRVSYCLFLVVVAFFNLVCFVFFHVVRMPSVHDWCSDELRSMVWPLLRFERFQEMGDWFLFCFVSCFRVFFYASVVVSGLIMVIGGSAVVRPTGEFYSITDYQVGSMTVISVCFLLHFHF